MHGYTHVYMYFVEFMGQHSGGGHTHTREAICMYVYNVYAVFSRVSTHGHLKFTVQKMGMGAYMEIHVYHLYA